MTRYKFGVLAGTNSALFARTLFRGDDNDQPGRAGKAVAEAVPGPVHRVLEAQAHNVAPQAILPDLPGFFAAA